VYWEYIDKISHVAAFLDPHYKRYCFPGKTVEEILNPIQHRLPATNLNIIPVPKMSIFWKMHQTEFPLLSNLAQDYLFVQASSVPCEQLFSIAGIVINKTRNRLLSE
ncbi:903_t:CDS:2, partial [Racocetra persica]